MAPRDPDVIVVGAGNAAMCAAIAAAEAGARVVVLERAPEDESGGNTAFTVGAMRVAYAGRDDLLPLLSDSRDRRLAATDFGAYPVEEFVSDLMRVTGGRSDPGLAALVAEESLPTVRWMRSHGVRFEPSYGQQAFDIGGRWRFWGGLVLRVVGEGKGLVTMLIEATRKLGVTISYGTRAASLLRDKGGAHGVRVEDVAGARDVRAAAVVLACGGFEANAEWRVRHLGSVWKNAKVRGTRHNTGDGIRMALEAGAAPYGDWSGCHSVAWDREAPASGDLRVAHEYTRNSYQFGICVNARGQRFFDEGADFRNYTYAAYGRELLVQPGGVAWQVFDDKVSHLLRREYARDDATVVEAATLEELVAQMGIATGVFLETVLEFNGAVKGDAPFEPTVLDGRRTEGLAIPKSNWAQSIDTPPFRAYAVTCGITFTFGGVHVDTKARVLDDRGAPIAGLYAAGEMVGGLYWSNYPGGTGLTAGAVLGRTAGASASGRSAI